MFCFVFTPSLFSQNFIRIIELKNPARMHGQDILNLQNQLLALGFGEIGEPDGYYGPLTEGVIKNIQNLSGFESDGKVNRILWEYIFNNNNATLLQNINTALIYDLTKISVANIFDHSFWGEPDSLEVYYYITEQKAKKLTYSTFFSASGFYKLTCHFVDNNHYFFKFEEGYFNENDNWDKETDEVFLVNNDNCFKIVNGILQSATEKDFCDMVNKAISNTLNKLFSKNK